MNTITAELAWRLRQRGIRLPKGCIYAEELQLIVTKQQELWAELDELDQQIKELTNDCTSIRL